MISCTLASRPAVNQLENMEICPREKSKWPASFILAVLLHAFILFGGQYALVQSADYGIQASAASIDVYMVAALPQTTPVTVARSEDPLKGIKTVDAVSDMKVPETQKISRYGEEVKKMTAVSGEHNVRRKSKARGDGSSRQAGEDATTLFSSASAEVQGKAGKYKNRPPSYPSIAQANGWEGVVFVKARIEKEGEPAEVLLEKSSGYPVLDKAALTAVRKWKFVPGRLGNIEVASWVKIPIKFQIDKKQRA